MNGAEKRRKIWDEMKLKVASPTLIHRIQGCIWDDKIIRLKDSDFSGIKQNYISSIEEAQ